jgi:nucleotide-binding universal stress UspA family protein
MMKMPRGFRHILAVTDGSQLSITAGQLAVQLTALHKARLTFVYVIDDSVVDELATASGRQRAQVQSELELAGQRYLDHLSQLAAAASLSASKVMRHGVTHKEVANLAREQEVDLIVVGRVGSRGPRRILIGSVTERLIEHAPCAVLVVR